MKTDRILQMVVVSSALVVPMAVVAEVKEFGMGDKPGGSEAVQRSRDSRKRRKGRVFEGSSGSKRRIGTDGHSKESRAKRSRANGQAGCQAGEEKI